MPNIRPANPTDCPALCDMIGLLAAHHGDLSAATPESLQRDLFSPHPVASILIAEISGKAAGYVALTRAIQLQAAKRTMDMHHLFVRENARGKGVGAALVKAALALAVEEDCAYLTVSTDPENSAAQGFYLTCGFAGYQPHAKRFRLDFA
jgi:GNAT superfamily N-acetyltransferase